MTANSKTGDIIVVREDAVYYYTSEGRGLCFANDGTTSLVSTFQDYVALVSPPPVSSSGRSDSIGRRFGGSNAEALFNAARFTMVDPMLQIVGHSESLISEVKAIFKIWGDLFVLTQDGKVRRIDLYSTEHVLIKTRLPATMRSHCSRDSNYYTNETYSRLLLILRRSPAWNRNNKMSYTGNTVTIYIRKETTIVLCLSISRQLITPSLHKSSER